MITEDELKGIESESDYIDDRDTGNVTRDVKALIAELRFMRTAYANAKANFAGNFLLQLELVRLFEPEAYEEWAKTHKIG